MFRLVINSDAGTYTANINERGIFKAAARVHYNGRVSNSGQNASGFIYDPWQHS